MGRAWYPVGASLVLLALAGGLSATEKATTAKPSTAAAATPLPAPILAAVGDIACRPGRRRLGLPGQPRRSLSCHHAATAGVAARLRPAVVAVLGDAQYDRGALSEFRRSFALTWGRFSGRLRPVPGNHEYETPGASGYFDYFGASAGPRGSGYYSYDVGAWHVVALNSNCAAVSCARGSVQQRWLQADLAAHPRRCTLAYWHHPRFSSGFHGNATSVGPLWDTLFRAGADVVLSGHEHNYERFAPQDGTGRRLQPNGMRQLVVGTGGNDLGPLRTPKPNSERRNNTTFGVLAVTLRPAGYSWRFVPEPRGSFRDAGSAACH